MVLGGRTGGFSDTEEKLETARDARRDLLSGSVFPPAGPW